jgi:hypothetical protein
MDTLSVFVRNVESDEQFVEWMKRAAPSDVAEMWDALLDWQQDGLVNARERVSWAIALLADTELVAFIRALPIDGECMENAGIFQSSIFDWRDASECLWRARRRALRTPTRANLMAVAAAANKLADVCAGDALYDARIGATMMSYNVIRAANAAAEALGARNAASVAPTRGHAFDQVYVWALEVEREYRAQLKIIRGLVFG